MSLGKMEEGRKEGKKEGKEYEGKGDEMVVRGLSHLHHQIWIERCLGRRRLC
jgi:hypothetical protein